MNAPGSPSSRVADDVLGRGLDAGQLPLDRRGETGAAPTAQPGGLDLFDDLFGCEVLDAVAQGAVTAVSQIVVDAQRIDDAAVLEHDAGSRRRIVPHEACLARGALSQLRGVPPGAAQQSSGTQVTPHDSRYPLGCHLGVDHAPAVAVHHLDQRLTMTQPPATDGLDHTATRLTHGRLDRLVHRARAVGDAARAQTDTELGRLADRGRGAHDADPTASSA